MAVSHRLIALVLAAALGLGAAGGSAAQSITLWGPNGQTRTVTGADLAAMPHETATLAGEHGPAKTYDGVPLTLLLQSVGAPAGKTLRGPAMADVVLVLASDGYRVALALAETDPGVSPRKTLVADRAEGAPLGPTEGPFRLVVEGDLRPARSVRMVTTITVEAPPATR